MKKSLAFVALASVLAAPAFAQTHVQSSSNTAVTSGTGIVVTPGAPAAAPMVSSHPLPGSVSSQISSTQTTNTSTSALGAGPSTTTTTTTVTRYWVNVPPGVENDPSFQRWMRLK